ncbi:MAG: tRNA 4-thiouridine(8) synthase ThiI [Erysipelotrichaceae bacterium]|nr:tRNA 4-thiouridine(8) synthase ThiI [Erysipelotrichaceae bacterium]
MEYNYELILVRFGELSTKGKNKKTFIKQLQTNVKTALSGFPKLKYERTIDRLYIELNGENVEEISPILQRVFGIRSFSLAMRVPTDIDSMVEAGYQACMKEVDAGAKTFKVEARRNWKQFELISDQINRRIASYTLTHSNLKVDVHTPDFKLIVEVRQDHTYIMAHTVLGAGGYPVGVGGRAMLMLSGGIDSPVAGYLTMKRGIEIECIHYASPPYTSEQAQNKVKTLAKMLSQYQGKVRLHIVPFTELQLAIYENCDESYAITIMRRMMYRLADRLGHNRNCLAIVNGESVGQVASQTLESMQTINIVTDMPVIRPVVTYDKLEIIDIAKRIDTYETSILPYEDCCTIFTPKNPVTKPNPEKAEKFERKFDYESLMEKALQQTETMVILPKEESKHSDLF